MSQSRKGLKHSDESKEKMRQIAKKRGISKEVGKKMKESRKGKKLSEEHKSSIHEET
jgi:hypothetical protein